MISFQNVSYSYLKSGYPKNLDSINLEVKKGECILLCGKSGCGKTTVTRLLNGMIPNFYEGKLEGRVLLDGENLLDLPMYQISKKVGSVFQNPRTQFYTVNTTSEIAFGCENQGIDPKEIAERVRKTAKDLNIENLLDRNIFNLSGGEKQIIAFASIYAMSPGVYVLDEPSSNLDTQAIEKLKEVLILLKKQKKTIIIAEHLIYYLKNLVDRAIYMENGRIVKVYSMQELSRFTFEEQKQSGIRSVDLLSYPFHSHTVTSGKHSLEIEDLHCFYGKKEVLFIPNLSIPSGHITAIIGTNGAGKSTFVSTMCGLIKKAKGTLRLDKKKKSAKQMLKQSYQVMQEVNHQLFSDSVREEIMLGSDESMKNSLQEIMDTLDISMLAQRHPMTLSGGQKQRVIIASAMFCDKKILYFDEPTSGLDFTHMIKTCNLLKQLQGEDVFLFIVTHDYELILSACDSVIHIESGEVKDQYNLDVCGIEKLQNFFLKSNS